MKKTKFLLLFAAVNLTSIIYAQMPKWTVGNSLIGFSTTGGNPQLLTNSLGSLGTASGSNAAFDANGDLLFYVLGGDVYNKNNTYVGMIPGAPLNRYTREVSIVNVPGTCNEFYIIAMTDTPTCNNCTNSFFYTKVTVDNTTVTMSTSQAQFFSYSGYRAFAISKLRKNKSRYLFLVGSTVERFLISNNGISHQQTLPVTNGNMVSDVELYEDTNTGNMKLAYGNNYSYNNTFNSYGLRICNLDQNGNLISTINPDIQGVSFIHGVEFVDNNKMVIAQDNSNANNKGIAIINTASSPSVNFIPNTGSYYNSYIEKAIDGKFYVSKENAGYKLASINPNNSSVAEVPNLTIPNMYNVFGTSLLPDQIDDENYSIANYRWDLAAFDDPSDIGAEPYIPNQANQNLWRSEYIWNRKTFNGVSITHETPGYSSDTNKWNVMRFKVRNIGCEESQESRARVYWTMGATDETWDNNPTPVSPPSPTALNSWDGSKCINNPSTNTCVKAGGELTLRSTMFNNNAPDYDHSNPNTPGFIIPPLQPGQEIIIDAKWQPVNPSSFGDANVISNPVICFLGRISDVNDPMYSEPPANSLNSLRNNVRNNNNVVTRNTALVPLGVGEGLAFKFDGSIFLGNTTTQEKAFIMKLDKYSGSSADFGEIGRITLTLDKLLWEKWKAGGSAGKGIQVLNSQKHEIQITDFQHAQLENIILGPGENRAVKFSFELKQPTDLVQDHIYAISQSLMESPDEDYGSVCSFDVTVNKLQEEGDPIYEDPEKSEAGVTESNFKGNIKMSPNPSSDFATLDFELLKENNLTIQVFDIYGKMVRLVENNKSFAKGLNNVKFSTLDLPDGNYFVIINAGDEKKSLQLMIKH